MCPWQMAMMVSDARQMIASSRAFIGDRSLRIARDEYPGEKTYSSFFGSFDIRSSRSCISFIC